MRKRQPIFFSLPANLLLFELSISDNFLLTTMRPYGRSHLFAHWKGQWQSLGAILVEIIGDICSARAKRDEFSIDLLFFIIKFFAEGPLKNQRPQWMNGIE